MDSFWSDFLASEATTFAGRANARLWLPWHGRLGYLKEKMEGGARTGVDLSRYLYDSWFHDLTWLVSYSQVQVYSSSPKNWAPLKKCTVFVFSSPFPTRRSHWSWWTLTNFPELMLLHGMSHARPGWMSIFWRPVMRGKIKSCGLRWGLVCLGFLYCFWLGLVTTWTVSFAIKRHVTYIQTYTLSPCMIRVIFLIATSVYYSVIQCWLNILEMFCQCHLFRLYARHSRSLCEDCLLDFQGPIWVKLVYPLVSWEKYNFLQILGMSCGPVVVFLPNATTATGQEM